MRVPLPPAAGLLDRSYAALLVGGRAEAADPFSGAPSAEIELRVAVGTAAQLAATEELRAAVSTLQGAALRRRFGPTFSQEFDGGAH